MSKLSQDFKVEASEFHGNGREVFFPEIKEEKEVAEMLVKYCSLDTMMKVILGNGYKIDEILKIASQYSEDFEEEVIKDVPGTSDLFNHIITLVGPYNKMIEERYKQAS
jgi:hypothetical protein